MMPSMADQGTGNGYAWRILNRPSYAVVQIGFSPGGSVYGEAGSMVYHGPGLAIETKLHGGCMGLLGKVFSRESLLVSHYRAERATKLCLAPTAPGDVAHIPMNGSAQRLAASAFLAASSGVTVNTALGGCRSFLGGSGLFVLEAVGTGDLFVSGFGGIIEIPVNGSYVVDTGHLVAWDPSLQYTIRRVGGWKSTFLSGEGLVCEFTGTGRVLISSRNISALVSWISPWLPS